jgi:hypothetical protein
VSKSNFFFSFSLGTYCFVCASDKSEIARFLKKSEIARGSFFSDDHGVEKVVHKSQLQKAVGCNR